ncbi:MAG TPA: carboxymuconolactone decarboxylase family protein [Rhizomicrobium sp.]
MTGVARVPPPAANGTASDPLSRSPLNHQPELWAAFMRLYGTLWSRGVLDHPTKEVARLRNARVTGCGYCRNVRFAQARVDGLSEELVEQITDDFEDSDLSERFKLVIRYTDASWSIREASMKRCGRRCGASSPASRSLSSPPASPCSWASRRSPSCSGRRRS